MVWPPVAMNVGQLPLKLLRTDGLLNIYKEDQADQKPLEGAQIWIGWVCRRQLRTHTFVQG